MPGQLWLIRHGETEWSRSGAHTGRTDLPLTPEGMAKAEGLSRILRGRKFARALSSPLARALETCRLAGYGDGVDVEPDLREWDYGDYEGRTTPEIQKDVPGWSVWVQGPAGGETLGQVAARAEHVIERAAGASGDVALFSHGHLLRILTARWLGLPPDAGRLLALSTASVSVLGYERTTRVIARWNLTAED